MKLERKKFPDVPATPYAELRPRLRSGDVLLCSGTGVFSHLIRRATRSVWSHVALVLRVESIDRVLVLESVEPIGVRTVRLSKYLTNYANDGKPYPGRMAVIRHRDFGDASHWGAGSQELGDRSELLTQLARCAVVRFGYPYDKEQIAIIAARIAAGRLGFSKKERARLERNDAYICSEYVEECFRSVGIEVPWNGKGFIAPADFACAECFGLVGVLEHGLSSP